MNQQGLGHSQRIGQLLIPKNEADQIIGNPTQGSTLTSPTAALPAVVQASGTLVVAGPPVSYQQLQQKREKDLRQRLKTWWAHGQDVKKITEFKNHCLPLARIKKIMKADEDVKMISAEAPIVFARACEMFILDLTMRSWDNTEENKRKTLQRSDVTAAISRTDIFDFLVDVIPKEEVRNEPLFSMPRTQLPAVAAAADSPNYYHVPQQLAHPIDPGENMNRTVVDPDLYRRHIPYAPPPVLWYQQGQQQQQEQQQPQSPSDS